MWLVHIPQHVAAGSDASRQWVVGLREVVGLAVVYHVSRPDLIVTQSRWTASRTDGLRETERQKADKQHEHEDDADQSHLLPPSALLLPLLHAETAQQHIRTPERDEMTVRAPQTGCARGFVNLLLALLLGFLRCFLSAFSGKLVWLSLTTAPGVHGIASCARLLRLRRRASGRRSRSLDGGRLRAQRCDLLFHLRISPCGRRHDVHVLGMLTVVIVGLIMVVRSSFRSDQTPLSREVVAAVVA